MSVIFPAGDGDFPRDEVYISGQKDRGRAPAESRPGSNSRTRKLSVKRDVESFAKRIGRIEAAHRAGTGIVSDDEMKWIHDRLARAEAKVLAVARSRSSWTRPADRLAFGLDDEAAA